MPHVIVKLLPGMSAEQKARMTNAIVSDLIQILDKREESISVAFEEVTLDRWSEQVVKPDILGKWDMLTKEPGYDTSD